ncbi:MAG: hypothetical protein NVSMB19_04390 [Vulcanimicrobiaceae bacterium]
MGMGASASADSEVSALEAAVHAYAADVRRAVDCDVVFVFAVDRTGSILLQIGQDGAYEGYPVPVVYPRQGLTGLAFSEGRFKATDDYARMPYRRVRGMMLGVRSMLALPLRHDDARTTGIVACVSREPAAFVVRERELTRRIGAVPVVFAHVLEMLGELRLQQGRFYTLQRLVRANAERVPLETACANISEIAAEAVGADYMVVGRRTADATTTFHGPYGVTSTMWSQGALPYAPLPIELETALASGETIVVDLTTIADDDPVFAQSKAEAAKTVAIVPIVAQGQRIGTLHAGWRLAIEPPKRTIEFLATLAAQASVALTDEWRKDDAALRAELDIARATNRFVAAELRKTLAADKLEVVYQPIFDLATGRVVECEALARWPDAPAGFADPELFVRLAEDYGAIGMLTDRVVFRALRDLPHLPSDVRVAINVSMLNLLQPDFAKRLLRVFAASRVAPARFTIELTETASVVDREGGREAVSILARAGVGISIDDFGEGYSALSYLKMFPATTIKIHRRYIENVRADAYDDAIVRSIVDLAHRINMDVVAEGVEDADVLEVLRTIGCDRVQGYGCARPMTLDALREFFASPRANIGALGVAARDGSAVRPSA